MPLLQIGFLVPDANLFYFCNSNFDYFPEYIRSFANVKKYKENAKLLAEQNIYTIIDIHISGRNNSLFCCDHNGFGLAALTGAMNGTVYGKKYMMNNDLLRHFSEI